VYESVARGADVSDLQPDVILAAIDSEEETAMALDLAAGGMPLILLASGNAVSSTDAFQQGARAVLPADLTEAQLAAAIEAVAAGLGVFHPDEVQHPAPASSVSASAGRLLEPLTPREIEVLRAMADGLGNKEIGARLGISENTVKFHAGSVMGKLGASTRTEAVMLGIRHGIVFI
jgi:DNA-binding NarL/FixJ family response regulator